MSDIAFGIASLVLAGVTAIVVVIGLMALRKSKPDDPMTHLKRHERARAAMRKWDG